MSTKLQKKFEVGLKTNYENLCTFCRYSGQMIGHSKEGWGTAFCKEGNVIYEGDWHQGKRHGHGTHMSLQSGKLVQRYTGNYSSSNE